MCGVWKQPGQASLPPEVLRNALRDRLFRRVDCVGITGGEPSLYPFLPEAVDIVASTLPKIRHLSITTNGLHPERWSSLLPAIAESCRQHGVTFRLELSVDGLGEVHDRIRGRTGAFRQAMEVAALARSFGVPLQIQATVSSGNVYAMMRLLQFCRARGDELVVRLATPIERLQNFDAVSSVALTDGEQSFFADFLDSEELHEATASPLRRLFCRDLARRLRTGGTRRAPCCFQGEAVLLCSNGDLFLCSKDREPIGNVREGSAYGFYFSERARRFMQRLRNDTCPNCLHDQTAPWPSVKLLGEALRRTGAFQRLRRAGQAVRILAVAAARLPAAWRQARKGGAAIEGKPFRSALLLGNYGGEHVGDAAILGGVLLRLRNERDLQRAWVASFRPDRTRRWLSSIEPAVPVEVIPYHWDALRESIGTAEALVMAGGPLMELPDLLLRHL
ncbi:MAG: radical SAM protein, partial [Planctomycetota bacterium]